MSANDIAEFDATGMLIVYPAVCVKVNHAFHAYKLGLSAYNCVGITLFVSTQGCGRPQITDGQQVDTHVFCGVEERLSFYYLLLTCLTCFNYKTMSTIITGKQSLLILYLSIHGWSNHHN